MKRRRFVLIVATALALATGAVSAVSPPWRYAAGTRSEGRAVVAFELWWRGQDAVLRERSGDGPTFERRCEAGTYRSLDFGTRSRVVRVDVGDRDCLTWATGNATDAAVMARVGGLTAAGEEARNDGTALVFRSPAGGATLREVVADRRTGLPIEIVRADGGRVTWSYAETGHRSDAPPAGAADAWYSESYRTLSVAEAGAAMALGPLPERIGRYRLETAFDYGTDTTAGTRYAFWRTAGGSEIQVVRGLGRVDEAEVGVTNVGGAFLLAVQHGPDYIYVFAPDIATLEAARRALRL